MFCHSCEIGHKCAKDKGSPGVECETGEYSQLKDDSCHICEKGHYCPNISKNGNLQYIAKNEQLECETGTYQELEGQTKCKICPTGKSCNNEDGELPCPINYYSNEGEMSCEICPEGFVCGALVRPQPGEVGTICSKGVCESCPVGNYCPNTTSTFSCSSGEISGEISEQKAYCRACANGEACPTTSPLDIISCNEPNKYSTSSATICSTCEDGEYCPYNWNARKNCPNISYKGGGNTTCTPVQPGYEFIDNKSVPDICTPGIEYSTGLEDECHRFLDDYKLLNNLTSLGPVRCGFGEIGMGGECSYIGINKETWDNINTKECPRGYYSPENESWCRACPPGYNCIDGEINKCTKGEYSPEGDSNCHACNDNSESICVESSGWPVPCPMGNITNINDNTCDECEEGTYSLGSTNRTCQECPSGYYCPYIHAHPIMCPLGHYSQTNATYCTVCDDGYRCLPGSNVPTQLPCPKGFYCHHTLHLTHEFYLEQIIPCPSGYLSTRLNLTNASECMKVKCPKGFYCPPGTYDNSIFPCPKGHYCPDGTSYSTQFPCTNGTYNDKIQSTDNSSCLTCDSLFYCPKGSSFPIKCPLGYDCSSSGIEKLSDELESCHLGQYPRPYPGGCIDCPKGAYCPSQQLFPSLCPVIIYIYIYINL